MREASITTTPIRLLLPPEVHSERPSRGSIIYHRLKHTVHASKRIQRNASNGQS